MSNYGELGSGRLSNGERSARARKLLRGRPRIAAGWQNQCRCGSTWRVLYQQRYYCSCGRWLKRLMAGFNGAAP